MISPSRQAIFIFFFLILLSVQELESKDRISVQELEFKDRSERNGRLAKEGSDGVRHKNNVNKNQKENKKKNNNKKNQKEERSKKAQKEHLAKSHLGMKSENRNLKAEKKRNVRKLGKDIQKKKRKSSSKPRYDKLMECIIVSVSLNLIGIRLDKVFFIKVRIT